METLHVSSGWKGGAVQDPTNSSHDEGIAPGAPSAIAETPAVTDVAGTFDPRQLEASSSFGWLKEWLLRDPRRLTRVARLASFLSRFFPLFGWAIVVRHDQVREVLSEDEHFPVAWGPRMVEVTQGQGFVLGMRRDDEYRLSYTQLAEAFPLEDVAKHVAQPAADISKRILSDKKHSGTYTFDAVQDLIAAVPTELCESYFGVQITDKPLFAKWTLAISSYLFGPRPSKASKELAAAAAAHLRGTIRESIANARSRPNPGIVLPRMITMSERDHPELTDAVIHAQLFGMIMGFIPTNVLAGGNILETLLRRPDFMERARAAALVEDETLLWRCLRETLRFRHINPGPWRICPKGYVLGAADIFPMRIRPGSKVLAIIQAAMFDPSAVKRPQVFDPERSEEDYLTFGVGQHWCLGAYIARAQITQTFKELLGLRHLKAVDPAVRTKRFNDLFPLHLMVRFEA